MDPSSRKPKCLTLSGRGVLIIPTPGGLIEIRRVAGDARKLLVSTPDGMDPAIGDEEDSRAKALHNSPLLREEHGKIVPTFAMVVPRLRDGQVDGVRVPAALVLEDVLP